MQVPPLPRSRDGSRRFLDAYTQGLSTTDGRGWGSAKELGWATFAAVEHHTDERRLLDDLTVLVARKLPPLPIVAVAEGAAVGV